MRPLTRLLDFFSVDVPAEASIVAHADNPRFRRTFLKTMGRNLYGWGIGLVGRTLLEKPTLVTDKDWDTLIVLDACRYDTLSHVWARSGGSDILPSVVSPGTTTLLWIRANFVANPAKDSLEDVTVIAGNPYMSKAYFDFEGWSYPFRKSVDVWKGGWDGNLEAVPPEEVFRAAREVHDGRLLAHFYQPHFPLIQDPEITWAEIEAGEVPLERARKAYEDNLRLALAWALRIVESVDGRVVITADHGELFGEYGLFSHPHKVYVPELVTVPWIELEGGRTSRRSERGTQETAPIAPQWGT
jgi:hypothetical protein